MTADRARSAVHQHHPLSRRRYGAERQLGAPGLPLGAAPMAYVLWTRYLKHNPDESGWIDRDRFVLSAGHASALLYALLHLTGYEDMTLDQLKRFRQWGSLTPGHPESHLTTGVEASTGPLGQGIGNAVGMAIAEAHLAARYNRPGHEVFDHYTYVLASDGDMMEGVQSEAASLAGHLRLGKLIVLYDDNHVTLSGTTSLAFTEDVARATAPTAGTCSRSTTATTSMRSQRAMRSAQRRRRSARRSSRCRRCSGTARPTRRARSQAHGNPLGDDEVKKTKQNLGWPEQPPFYIPDEALAHFRIGARARQDARGRLAAAVRRLRAGISRARRKRSRGVSRPSCPTRWDAKLPQFRSGREGHGDAQGVGGGAAGSWRDAVPELVGGSGDLDPSTYTWLKQDGDFESPLAPAATACKAPSAAAGATAGATSISACASTRWARR